MVRGKFFATIVGNQDTTHENVRTQCACHADTVPSLTM